MLAFLGSALPSCSTTTIVLYSKTSSAFAFLRYLSNTLANNESSSLQSGQFSSQQDLLSKNGLTTKCMFFRIDKRQHASSSWFSCSIFILRFESFFEECSGSSIQASDEPSVSFVLVGHSPVVEIGGHNIPSTSWRAYHASLAVWSIVFAVE